jgi:hypothetical protein
MNPDGLMTYAEAMEGKRQRIGALPGADAEALLDWYYNEASGLFDTSAMNMGPGGGDGAAAAERRHQIIGRYLSVRRALEKIALREQRILGLRWRCQLGSREGRLPASFFGEYCTKFQEFALIVYALRVPGKSNMERKTRARILYRESLNAFVEARRKR